MLDNLKELGLELENVYVQNLLTEVQNQETSKNKEWFKLAEQAIPERKKEFDKIDPTSIIPVFLTSHHLYRALINPGEKVSKPREIYKAQDIIISANQNKLCRPLLPLYRHPAYSLKANENYKLILIKVFNK